MSKDKHDIQERSYLIYVICVCVYIVVSTTYCVVFLLCLSSSCVPYVASFSGLFIFEYAFGLFIYIYMQAKHELKNVILLSLSCPDTVDVITSIISFLTYSWGGGGGGMALVNLFIYAKNMRPFVLVESSSDEVYSIQNYVIKFVSDLRQVGGFFRAL